MTCRSANERSACRGRVPDFDRIRIRTFVLSLAWATAALVIALQAAALRTAVAQPVSAQPPADAAAVDGPSRDRPSVLVILTDDQGWGDLHGHGNRKLDTPHLDELSRQSVRFDRFFVSPVCAPTRAALLTGRFPARTGVIGVTKRQEVMRAEEVTIAEIYKRAGYATGCFGKWHNGEQYPNHPLGQGFDEFFGFCGGHWNNYFDPHLEHNGHRVKTKGYITDVITDAALRFIEANAANPFLCYVPYNAPHSPWQTLDREYDKYLSRGFDAATSSAYAMVDNLDDNIGRVLDRLNQLNLSDNTIVVFVTDNGPNGQRFNGGMRGTKASVHEGGVRVPCFIRWPGELQPRDVQPVAAHVDLLPTLAELCDVPIPHRRELDGTSLVPLLRSPNGTPPDWPDRRIITYRPVQGDVRGAVRTQRYRFVREKRGDQLYDMVEDPAQNRDLARSHPDVLRELGMVFEQYAAEVENSLLQRSPIPVGYAVAPLVRLPAVEASLDGRLSFRNVNGFAHDWITDWRSESDRIAWDLEIVQGGKYEVVLSYACADEHVGAKLKLSANLASLTFTLDRAFDEGEFARPERTRARGPRWMRRFTTATMGVLALPKGPVSLTLQAVSIPGETVCELDSIQLRRLD